MTTKPRVFVSRQIDGEALSRLAEIAEVSIWPGDLPPVRQELLRQVVGCHGLLTMLSDPIDGEMMDAAGDQLRVVSNYAVGFNNIDVAAARHRGVAVGNTPDVLTDATADTAAGLLIAAARNFKQAIESVQEGRWKTWEPRGCLGVPLRGKTLGVVGMGRIGQALAERMVGGFGMRLLYSSRDEKPAVDENLGGRRVDLDTLVEQSDFISVHVALTEETHHLIDAALISQMKSSVVIVNTARGEIIDQEALALAVQQRRIFAVGLDVTTPEPLPPEHTLVQNPFSTVLPHIGSADFQTRHRMTEIAVENVTAGLLGQPLPYPVG